MHPNSLANLKRFEPGHRSSRRSNHVLRTITMARKHSPEAMKFCIELMRNTNEPTQYRLKASELILEFAVPKGKNGANLTLDPGANAMRIEIVDPQRPGETITIDPQPLPNGHDTDDGPVRLTFAADEEN